MSSHINQYHASGAVVIDIQARFRELVEENAVRVDDGVMHNVLLHFSGPMHVMNTAQQALELYKRAAKIPRTATTIALKDKNISVGRLDNEADICKSILMDILQDGRPCLLKITDMESVEHELVVWQAIKLKNQENGNCLVSLEKLEFTKEARLEHGLMGGGTQLSHEHITAGILMEKYQSTLARCTIPLTETVLLRFGGQVQTALSVMHSCGYCHMDVKPANIFLEQGNCLLGDFGAATGIGKKVKEYTMGYYPSDAGETAEKETDFLLLAVTLMEMFDCIKSPPVSMTKAAIKEKVTNVENENVKVFLQSLTVPPP
jgi:hypothetical protein